MIQSVGADLPAGTVTVLFTDIEGSTRLIAELGEEGYVQALTEHRRLLRGTFAEHGGVEVDTQGDAFLYAFGDPVEALAAAADGQEALASGRVAVRMGLHTGKLQQTGEGYAGRELHRAARIAASGHGGQVVVSAATRALVDGELIELGEHRFKDFDEPVALFQLGSQRFPPLRTISNTNLPRPASSFVGRQRERDELVSMLSDGTRLLTLSGPGGSGKTRLAIEAASELVPVFKAGVFWVGLSALRDPALVVQTIAQAVGAKKDLAAHVSERELLLLLDNFEQVVEAAPELSQLLEACPNLRLLVTSRELLRISGEVDYPVPPLAEPEAVELFCARAQLEPDETVPELCRRLDELPLALELAAARTSVLSPAQILERLAERLDLLKGGRAADPRQKTLRATIEWSHDLLDEAEKQLFARLAVFAGGCTLEAAEQVADAEIDTLHSLVDKSLLRHTGERFWMLETIHEYARERLGASGEEAELRRLHAVSVLESVERADREIREAQAFLATAVARIDAEHDNIRAALEWSRDTGENEMLLRLVATLTYTWPLRGHTRELRPWLELALERGTAPARARAMVLLSAADRASQDGDVARAHDLVAESRTIAEHEGDEVLLFRAMNGAAWIAADAGDRDGAREQFSALRQRAREAGNTNMVAIATVNLGDLVLRAHEFERALGYATEAVDLFRTCGDDGGVATSLELCGWSGLGESDSARAEGYFRESLAICGRLGAPRRTAQAAAGLGAALIARHEEERGTQLLAGAAAVAAQLGVGGSGELEEGIQNEAIRRAKAALGEEGFAATWAQGATMTAEEIVAFANTE
jgi:predicted ATPase/class 3 adenylate cyclase